MKYALQKYFTSIGKFEQKFKFIKIGRKKKAKREILNEEE